MKNIKNILIALAAISLPLAIPAGAFAAASPPHFYYGAWIPFWQAQPGQADIAVNLDSLD